ncbi:hypothetical protein D3C79_744760 [compost metagenome]
MSRINQQDAGTGKGADAIDVAVGHVAGDVVRIAWQPDGFLHAEKTGENFLDLGLGHSRVAVGVEQHRLGGDQGALAVDMNSPTFVAQGSTKAVQTELVEHAPRQAFVQIMRRLAAPGIEAPTDTGQPLLRVADEARAGVAAPAVVDRQFDQLDVRSAQVAGTGSGARVHHHLDRFEAGNGIGNTGKVHLNLLQGHAPAGLPQRLVVRPDHPGRCMVYPLCGHEPTTAQIAIALHASHLSVKGYLLLKTAAAVMNTMLWLHNCANKR